MRSRASKNQVIGGALVAAGGFLIFWPLVKLGRFNIFLGLAGVVLLVVGRRMFYKP